MSKVMDMVRSEAMRIAKAKGNFLPTSYDRIEATVKVMSGSKNEIDNIAKEVAAYNAKHNSENK